MKVARWGLSTTEVIEVSGVIVQVALATITLYAVYLALSNNKLMQNERRSSQAKESLEAAYVPLRNKLQKYVSKDKGVYPLYEPMALLSHVSKQPVLLARLSPSLKSISKAVEAQAEETNNAYKVLREKFEERFSSSDRQDERFCRSYMRYYLIIDDFGHVEIDIIRIWTEEMSFESWIHREIESFQQHNHANEAPTIRFGVTLGSTRINDKSEEVAAAIEKQWKWLEKNASAQQFRTCQQNFLVTYHTAMKWLEREIDRETAVANLI